MVSRARYVTGALGESPIYYKDRTTVLTPLEGMLFANDLLHRLDFTLTYISVAFYYTGPYFLK